MKLHIGCGTIHKEGWINIDADSKLNPDLAQDAIKSFPYQSNSIDFIFSEHFIEHLTVEGGVIFFKEAHRLLKPGGVIRTATFDMDFFLKHHQAGSTTWKEAAHWDSVGLGFIQTRMESLNIAVRWWGHQYVYNSEEMIRRLKEAGFNSTVSCEFKKSLYPELLNLENRPESDLIIEAIK